MSLFSRHSQKQSPRPAIESLESRAYFSAPDLLVTIPGPFHSAVAGATVNQKININIADANDSPSALRGPFTITLYVSTDQTLDSDAIQIAQHNVARAFVLREGDNHTFRLNVKSYQQNLDNNYFILGEVSATNAVGVSNSTIQILPPYKDFSASVPPIHHNGHVGGRLPVTVDVSNVGNVLARGNLMVSFFESLNPDGSSPVPLGVPLSKRIHILPKKTQVLHFLVPLPRGILTGNQFIVADVDPMDVYNDPNLLNNISVSGSPITVT